MASAETTRKYLVKTDHGTVLVLVNLRAGGLDADLISLEEPAAGNAEDIAFEVPLRAFSAKMLEIIEMGGLGGFRGGETLRRMLIREKATSELKRIERWAKERFNTP